MEQEEEDEEDNNGELMKRLNDDKDYSHTITLWHQTSRDGSTVTSWMVKEAMFAFSRQSQYPKVLELLEFMKRKGIEVTPGHLNIAMGAAYRAKEYYVVTQLWKKLQNIGETAYPESYNLYFLAKWHLTTDSQAQEYLFQKFRSSGVRIDNRAYRVVIKLKVRQQKREEAEKLFKEMLDNQVKPDEDVCKDMIMLYAKLGLHEEARTFFNKMQDFGVSPSERTYALLIQMYLDSNAQEKALELLQIAKDEAVTDQLLYNIFISHHVARGNLEVAEDFFEQTRKNGVVADSSLLLRLYTSSFSQENIKTFKDLERAIAKIFSPRRKVKPDYGLYESAIRAANRQKSPKKVAELYSRMTDDGFQPLASLSGILISTFSKLGKTKEAEEIFGIFKNSASAPPVYNSLLSLYAKRANNKRVMDIMKEAKEKNISVDKFAYADIIEMSARLQRPGQATTFYKAMLKEGLEPLLSTYIVLWKMFCTRNKVKESERFWRLIVERGYLPDLEMYKTFMKMYLENGNSAKVSELYSQLCKEGWIADGETNNIVKEANKLEANKLEDKEKKVEVNNEEEKVETHELGEGNK
eukprot:TRINITY_DN4594_c0_g1_i1.p1 TRINITY_DN4594_c0_g1~~TRINITY_DN4594_c0_g1_i1.p1  ORF type:complete len:581 (+),score=143.26 TRINITY_DN4594_c0_g1_i1:149-1891(+)